MAAVHGILSGFNTEENYIGYLKFYFEANGIAKKCLILLFAYGALTIETLRNRGVLKDKSYSDLVKTCRIT